MRKEARKVGLSRGGRGARVGPGGGCDAFAPGLALLVQVAQGGLEDGEGVAAVGVEERVSDFRSLMGSFRSCSKWTGQLAFFTKLPASYL